MIKLLDIKSAVTAVLATTGLKSYGSDVQEGFVRPCFFAQVMPTVENTYLTFTSENSILIDIVYFSENMTDLENMAMYDTLKKAFGRNLLVLDRHLMIHDFKGAVIDDVDQIFSIKFSLQFYDEIEDTSPVAPDMQTISINIKED